MSFEAKQDLGTNLRNDATAENSTQNKLFGSVITVQNKRFVEIDDVSLYKGRVVRMRKNLGFYSHLEQHLFKKNVDRYVDAVKDQLSNKGQTGWDILGTHAIANSLQRIGEEARLLGESTTQNVNVLNENITNTIREAVVGLMPVVNGGVTAMNNLVNNGIDHHVHFDDILGLFSDPHTALIACSILYLFVEIIERKFEFENLIYIKVLLGAFMVYKVGKPVVELLSSWLVAVPNVAVGQAGWTDWLEIGVQGALFTALGATLDFNTLSAAVRSLTTAVGSAIKLQEVFTSILEWFKKTADLVCGAFGVEVFDCLKPKDKLIREFIKRVNDLMTQYATDPMAVGVDFAEEVTRLLMEINQYISDLPVNSKNMPVNNVIRGLQDKLQVLHRNVVDAGMSLGERSDPALILIAGPPGAGKTYLSDFICQDISIDLCETPAEVMDARRDWKTNVYVWPDDNKHHDQYRGEKITLYPDLFCKTDAEGQPSEASSLVYVCGGQPHLLPAAEISKKQRLWFISWVILACTNVTYISDTMFKSVRNADAVKRRTDKFGWYMYVNPQYIRRNPDGSPIIDPNTNKIRGYEHDLEMYGMIDETKFRNNDDATPPADLWSFRRLNFSKGEFADNKIYNLGSFKVIYKDYIRAMRRAGEAKHRLLRARADILADEKLEAMMNGNNFPEADEVEFTIAPERQYEPIPKLTEKDFDLEIEARKRVLLKDKLDILRYEQLTRGRRDGPMPPPYESEVSDDEQYDTSDEIEGIDENVAQMDDDEFDEHERLRRRRQRLAELDYREIQEINFLDLAGSVGEVTSRTMHSEVQKSRHRAWRSYYNCFGSRITTAQHQRIKDILHDAQMLTNLTELSDLRGLAMMVATRGTDFSPRRGLVFRALQNAIFEMERDNTIGDLIKSLRVSDILTIASCEYENVNDILWTCKLKYLISDPLLCALNTAAVYLANTYNTFAGIYNQYLGHHVNVAYGYLRRLFYHPRVQFMLDIIFQSVAMTTSMLIVFKIIELIMPNSVDRKKAKKARKRAEADEEQQEALTRFQGDWASSEMNKKVIDKYMDNMCGLYVVIHTGKTVNGVESNPTRHPCNVLFLGGRIGVIVNHAKEGILKIQEKVNERPNHYVELVLVPFVGGHIDKSTERCRLEDVEFESTDELSHYDLSIIKFKKITKRPNMYNLIPPVKCLEYVADMKNLDAIFIERTTDEELLFNGPENRIPVRLNIGNDLGNYHTDVTVFGEKVRLSSYSYKTWVMKGRHDRFETRAGYCTSPAFLTDERKNFCVKEWPQAQQPWLCYLHTSLQDTAPNGAPVFREMFTKWINELEASKVQPAIDVIQENLEIYSDIIEEELGLKPNTAQADKMELIYHREMIDDNHMSLAVMELPLHVPFKSEIERSKLYGIEPRTRYPARMGTVRLKDGTIVDTMKKARTNYGTNATLLNGPLVDQIIHQAMARVMSDSSIPKLQGVLTLDQCIYGDGAYRLNHINWNSSCGYYLRMMKEKYQTKWKGKRWMLDDKDRMLPEMYRVVERLFNHFNEKLKRGERIYGLNIDNIKDELLKKEKVLQANSRLFCTNDMISLLLCKSYMGAFAGWIYDNRINNGIAIGVNPLSDEWTSIATVIVNNSPDCIFMDHSKFDKNQLRSVMTCVLILMDMYYNDKDSENSKIRTLLFDDIVDSLHVVMYKGRLYFYPWSQGNTSGNFLTAILNSLVNICYTYICCIFAWLVYSGTEPNNILSLPPNPADESIRIVCLGDDIVASIKKEKMPGVNFNTVKMMGAIYLGIEITDELKTGGIIPDFRSIVDGSFLGRSFKVMNQNGKNKFIGVLRRYSAVERIQWIKGMTDPEIEVEKVESTFLERSLDDREDFDKFVKLVAPACFEAYGKYPKYTDYDVAQRYALTLSEYKYSFNDFVDDEEFTGVEIGKILLKLKEQEYKTRYRSSIADDKASDPTDFVVKQKITETSVSEELSL